MTEVVPRFKSDKPKPKPRRKPIPTYSERRFSQKELREKLCELVYARDRGCRARLLIPSVACGGRLDVHEIIPRSAWAQGYLVISNTVAVCREHHTWIGDHPTEAHRLGLHGYSWERPDRRRAC